MPEKRNLRILYAIALLQGMVFYAPVASLYRQAAGLNFSQIALIEGVSYLLSLLLELPWGVIADRIGHRKTMILGWILLFLSKLVFWRANAFAMFLLERILLSSALAALSGVEESMLCHSCPKDRQQHAFGVSETCTTAGLLLSAGAYSLFMQNDFRFSALATALTHGLAMLLSLMLAEVQPGFKPSRSGEDRFSRLFIQTLRRPRLLLFLSGMALFNEAAQMITVWLNQNQYLRCGMNGTHMGWAYIFVSTAALTGVFSQRITRRMGKLPFAAALLLPAAAAAVLLIPIRSAALSVLLIALVSLTRAMLRPLTSAICMDQVQSASRATQLSIFAMMQNITSSGAAALLGRTADLSLNAAFGMCAAFCLLGLAAFFIFCRPLRS